MNRITILSLDDEPEVRQAISRDLEPFAELFRIEVAEDVEDAREVIQSIEDDGDLLGVFFATIDCRARAVSIFSSNSSPSKTTKASAKSL